jgi:ribosomal protein S12 methylthiotransferase
MAHGHWWFFLKSERKGSTFPKAKLSFISLGCSKNLVDSERMLGLLAQDGYLVVPESERPDLMIVNTCGFIDAARKESIGVIEEMIERKRSGEVKGLIVAGCLAERAKDTLIEQFPEVDHVVGVFGREEIARVADRLVGGLDEQRSVFRPAPLVAQDDRARMRITPRHLAYLKVSEGCDRFCTFCAIPYMRGKHVTKPIEMVVAEAEELAGDGVRELILVAQDMTYYGVDLYGRPRLAELLDALETVDGIDWIRILYCYPQYFTDELYETLGRSRKIVPYLDMPLQHINDRLLKLMNRRHTRQESEAIIDRLRATIPGLVLRTTFIVGFPGETEAEFAELLEFVASTRFERLGAFVYSLEPDTPAAKLDNHLPQEIKIERRDRLMAVQQPIAFAFNGTLVGQTLDVLIDAKAPEEKHLWMGRPYTDAPDVDGVTWVRGARLVPGDLVKCEIVGAEQYDLIARPVSAEPPRRRKSRPRPRTRPHSPLAILDDI